MEHDLAYVDASHFGWYVDASYLVAGIIIVIMVASSVMKYRRHHRHLARLSSRDDAS